MSCLDDKFICVYDLLLDSIIEKPIDNIGEIVFSKKSGIIFVKNHKYLYIIDRGLNKVHLLDNAFLDNDYVCTVNHEKKTLTIRHFDNTSNTITLDISIIKKGRILEKLFVVGDIIYVCIRDHVVFYNKNGEYLGNKFTYKMRPFHISSDNKYMLMKSSNMLINFDTSHITLKEQKIVMIAASPHFTKDPLFDRNLLPLIFDFLPKLDKAI